MLKWKFGDTTITQLIELVDNTGSIPVLPDATPENLAEIPWLKPHFVTPDGKLILNIQMMVIETPARRMVVDTCIGNDKTLSLDAWANMQRPFLGNLRQLGYDPDGIDTVICTHLHVDHVGWNTMKKNGKWVPTFPNARYVMVKEEFEHWQAYEDPFGPVFQESVQPVFDAGLVDLVGPDHQLGDGVWFESTPGHTPGHVSVHIRSQGEEAIISGDMMHHPCQIARPHWVTPFDDDNTKAAATRKAFLERYADTPVMLFGTHFANPVGGRIVRDGDTFRLAV
jgi:glyoxylase-like metal-dependent hydrolase (beta-lactamase superfamily II)